VVLFTHVTTHVKTDPYQTMLSEMGFTGFPSVAILDAEGRFVEGHVGGAKLDGLVSMLEKAQTYAKDVIAKADAGDKEAQKRFFLDRVERGSIRLADAVKGLEQIANLTKEERSKVEAKLPTLEMNLINGTAWQDRPAANAKLAAMFKAGRIPAGELDANRFLSLVLMDAEAKKDVQLFEAALAKIKVLSAGNPRGKQQIDAVEKRLEKLKEAAKGADGQSGGGTAAKRETK